MNDQNSGVVSGEAMRQQQEQSNDDIKIDIAAEEALNLGGFWKAFLLSMITFGIYAFFWLNKVLKIVRLRGGSPPSIGKFIWPVLIPLLLLISGVIFMFATSSTTIERMSAAEYNQYALDQSQSGNYAPDYTYDAETSIYNVEVTEYSPISIVIIVIGYILMMVGSIYIAVQFWQLSKELEKVTFGEASPGVLLAFYFFLQIVVMYLICSALNETLARAKAIQSGQATQA